MQWITTHPMPWLERYLDLAAVRHRLIANNLANIDTPGFSVRDIDFENEISRAIQNSTSVPSGVPSGGADQSGFRSEFMNQPEVREVPGLASRPDGNNVNLEREAALLAETQIRFQLGTQLMRLQFQRLRGAIQEGRNP